MAKFVTPLDVEMIEGTDPQTWRVLKPFVFESDKQGIIVVPSDFVTDFASVPRIPFAYFLTGNTAHQAAVVHDWLYTPPAKMSRKAADDVFVEACKASGIAGWRASLMWLGIRIGGGDRFQAP